MQVAVDEVQVGMRMQLLVRDPASGRQALEAGLKVTHPVHVLCWTLDKPASVCTRAAQPDMRSIFG